MKSLCFLVGVLVSTSAFAMNSPDPQRTPGVLCTKDDPDFEKIDYPEKIARCQRNVSHGDKQLIAQAYGGIPESRWDRYEFDHLIPLCAGGSDDLRNLWPQPIGQAHEKDAVEVEVCVAMKAGTLTQKAAVARIMDWFNQNEATVLDESPRIAFDCRGQREIAGAVIRLRGQVSANGNVSDVILTLAENTLAQAAGPLVPRLFRARTSLLSGHSRYVVETDHGDSVQIYLPADSIGGPRQTFVRVAFGDEFPRLERLTCN